MTLPYPALLLTIAVAVALALIGLAWTVSDHSLSVRVLTDSALISPDLNVETSLSVRWNDRPVSSLRLLEVSVENTGTEPIRSADFATDLNLVITDHNGEFLEARAIAEDPSILAPQIAVTANDVNIKPLLLNPGDSFTLRVITTSTVPLAVTVEARIAGVHDVSLQDARRLDANGQTLNHSSNDWEVISLVCFIFLLILLGLLIIPSSVRHDDWSFKGRNVAFLVWPAVLCLSASSYWVTLMARGISIDHRTPQIWLITIAPGLVSALALIILARVNKSYRTTPAVDPNQ